MLDGNIAALYGAVAAWLVLEQALFVWRERRRERPPEHLRTMSRELGLVYLGAAIPLLFLLERGGAPSGALHLCGGTICASRCLQIYWITRGWRSFRDWAFGLALASFLLMGIVGFGVAAPAH